MKKYNGLKNLPDRLRRQANNVESDGWLTAARLIREAADELEYYREQEQEKEQEQEQDRAKI